MLIANIKKILLIILLFLIYVILATITIRFDELKKPLLIIFGVNSLFAVLLYVSTKFYNAKKAKLIINTQEEKYLNSKHSGKVTPENIAKYFETLNALICLCIFIAGLPLVVAGAI